MSKAVGLHFEEYGEAERPDLLILHGFFASSRNWRQIAKKLAEYFHVYVVDMRNHGESVHVPDMDYPAMAADIELFLDTQKISKANILGHSMGGKAAMWFALLHPERVDRLIVADISPVTYQHSFDKLIQTLEALPLEQLANRKQADTFLEASIPELSFRQFLLQNLILNEGVYQWRIDLNIFAKTADNIIAFPDAGLMARYDDRVLFLGGETSDYIREESVLDLFPNAVFQYIAQAGHWIHAQQPEEFCMAVNDFLPE